MAIISIISIIIFLLLSILGLIYLAKKLKVTVNLIQIEINFRTMSSFFGMFVLGAILVFFIFSINIKLELIEIVSKQDLAVLLTNIPIEFTTALGEELFLRVLVFIGILSIKDNKLLALLLSSLIFCLLHSPDTHIKFISYFLAGLMYGISFLSFQTIWAPIGLHFSWNFFQSAIFGFPVGGQLSNGYLKICIIDNTVWNGGAYGPEGSLLGICARIIIIILILLFSFLLNRQLSSPDFLKLSNNNFNPA